MRFLVWNVRGLGKPARRRQIREYIWQENIDVVGLQETIKEDFSPQLLQEIDGGLNFVWHWVPSRGRSGGILMGVKGDVLELEEYSMGDYHIQMTIRNKLNNFRWVSMCVYGPAQHDKSRDFIDELTTTCSQCALPLVMGG